MSEAPKELENHFTEQIRKYKFGEQSVIIYTILLFMVAIKESSTKPISQQEDKIFKKIMGRPGKTDRWNLRQVVLHSAYRYRLEILPNGTVQGTDNLYSKYTKLKLHSIGSGIMRIYGINANKYLSINDKGFLIAQEEPTLNTVFQEVYLENYFQAFVSYKKRISKKNPSDSDWFVALKRSGKAKRAAATSKSQKSIKFIVIMEENALLGKE